MTSASEYELLRDKNIKEREALVSREQGKLSIRVWVTKLYKETFATNFRHCCAAFI